MTLRPILVGIGLVFAVTGGAVRRRSAGLRDAADDRARAGEHRSNGPVTHVRRARRRQRQGTASKERKVLYWKSSMTPGEIHDQPGKDSMGMDLIPVYEGEAAAGTIQIDPVVVQDMGVRFDTVKRGPLAKTVRTVGFVDYDETTLTVVTTKVDGWVEKLDVNQTGAQVHEGEPLFELYSPALFSAQEEYLAALRNLQKEGRAADPAVARRLAGAGTRRAHATGILRHLS